MLPVIALLQSLRRYFYCVQTSAASWTSVLRSPNAYQRLTWVVLDSELPANVLDERGLVLCEVVIDLRVLDV